MAHPLNRREFLTAIAAAASANSIGCASRTTTIATRRDPFKISLAQWSFHRALRAREFDHLDFARVARQDFGIGAIEYVNVFFADKARDRSYLAEMNRRAADQGVVQHLIMVDREGRLGDPDSAKRTEAIENHYKWVDAARELGCVTIRVNAQSEGSYDEQMKLAADGLRRLSEYGDKQKINVIVETHGGFSSNGQWLAGVMRLVNHARCGTLPDFGNFEHAAGGPYDRYKGTAELMPFAKGVSAKSHDFDSSGNETKSDYRRLLKIVVDAGYHSWVGIEYEGNRLSEREGVAATLRLLETIRQEMRA